MSPLVLGVGSESRQAEEWYRNEEVLSFLDEERQRNEAGLAAMSTNSGSAEVLTFSWFGFCFFLTFQ